MDRTSLQYFIDELAGIQETLFLFNIKPLNNWIQANIFDVTEGVVP